ncbi:AAEL005235-PA [Aedes aegypti]|uniref:AAEL005235-PA n=1 Tax=Aedes aegypti TaxID=7159 RepID=Q17AQ2_AEDAE|nr:AAEL005235-PA [Aedes aegypti]
MPQELRVVCCFQCRKFQSDIVKKSKKWTCKMCGAKQSLVKEFARGSGRECRLLVQQLSESSQQADRFERDVAEQVLAGKIEMPEIGNAIQDESGRLVANHSLGTSRKLEDGNSKWVSFCSKDDEEESEDLWQEKAHSSLRENKAKMGNMHSVRGADLKPGNLVKPISTRTSEQPNSTTKLVPLADFHQMDKQDKKQFKWQSKVEMSQISSSANKSSSTLTGKPLFSFKPKSSNFSRKELSEEPKGKETNITQKRLSSDNELNNREAPMMNFTKKSKWSNFKSEETEISSIVASSNDNETSQQYPSPVSTSKWNKFIPPATQEDDEIA